MNIHVAFFVGILMLIVILQYIAIIYKILVGTETGYGDWGELEWKKFESKKELLLWCIPFYTIYKIYKENFSRIYFKL